MYQEHELKDIRAQLQKRWILLIIPCVILLAAQIRFVIQRNQLATIVSGIILLSVFLFVFELLILPLIRYTRFLDEILHGPAHDVEGTYATLDHEESVIDGIPFRSMHFTCLDDQQEPYDRLFYLDSAKPIPGLHEGDKTIITYHDRFIVRLGNESPTRE